MLGWYKLVGKDHEVVPCTMEEGASRLFNRRIRETKLPNGIRISTVFLGLDHSHVLGGPPVVFETMVFGGPNDEYQERCSTYRQALLMHARVVRMHVVKLRLVK